MRLEHRLHSDVNDLPCPRINNKHTDTADAGHNPSSLIIAKTHLVILFSNLIEICDTAESSLSAGAFPVFAVLGQSQFRGMTTAGGLFSKIFCLCVMIANC